MRFYEFKTIISEATKGQQADIPKFDAPVILLLVTAIAMV